MATSHPSQSGEELATPPGCLNLLREHVAEAWFPHCIDTEFGGFFTALDRYWRPRSRQPKLLEFQARQTLVAAELSAALPDLPALAEATAVGFRFLRDVMWDKEHGGWYWMVDRAGRPVEAETKHLHGIAYAIEACFAVHAATGDEAALSLAKDAVLWIDDHAHDGEHGGYLEWLRRDGSPILDAADADAGRHDHIGTPLGCKDMNVHSDLLETFTYGFAVANDPVMRVRFDELLEITLSHYAAPGTQPYFFFRRDWTPADSSVRPATAVQTAGRLFEARALVEKPERLEAAAIHLVEHAFDKGWNADLDCLVFNVSTDQPATQAQMRNVPWWVQFEALKALSYLAEATPGHPLVRTMLPKVRATLSRDYVDGRHKGFFPTSMRTVGLLDRLLPRRRRGLQAKATMWKDASHDGRALLRLALPGAVPYRSMKHAA